MADPIDALPTPPSRSDAPATFISRANAFIAALVNFVTQLNVVARAFNFNATNSTSTTSLTIGTGSKSLTVDASKSYLPGQTVKIARTSDGTKWMVGDVTVYNSTTGALEVTVSKVQGSGTFTDWTVTQAATEQIDEQFVNNQTTVTPSLLDSLLFADASDSGKMKKAAIADVLGLGAPTRQMFTVAGSGTYTTPANCKFIRVRMQGGGGGGGARVTNNGSNGNATIFNSIEASGGESGKFGAGSTASRGGAGGTGGAGSATLRVQGGAGLLLTGPSSPGGASMLGYATGCPGTPNGGSGVAGKFGSGGGGGNSDSGSTYSGGGGGAGEYVEIDISSPSASYSYTVGAGGAGGSAGTIAGGAGGDGWIIVEEYY
jgi:hypothetical protein